MKNLSKGVKRLAGFVTALMLASSFAAASPAHASATRTLTVHLHRSHLSTSHPAGIQTDPNDLYEGVNLWMWDYGSGVPSNPTFDQQDDYGVYAQWDISGATKAKGGIITRLGSSWSYKEDVSTAPGSKGDRFIDINPTGDTEVWLLQDDEKIYTYNPLTTRFVNIHFTRTDGDFTGWNVYTWFTDPASVVEFTGSDCYGKIATLMIPDSVTDPTIGYLVRKSTDANPFAYQTADLSATLPTLTTAADNASLAARTADIWLVDTTPAGGTEALVNGKLDYAAPTTGPRSALKVHYHRDDSYTGWNIWHWGGTQTGAESDFIGTDDFGKFACVDYPSDNPPLTTYNVLFRDSSDWNVAHKDVAASEANRGMDAGNREITLLSQGQTEVWIMQGKNFVYTTAPELEAPQKSLQSIKATATKLKKGKTAALPAKSSRNLVIKWKSLTPKICSIASGKVKGLKVGSCRISAIQSGNSTVQAVTARRSITITK